MKYVSTIGKCPPATFREAIFHGLAPDGGLFVPQNFPSLSKSFLDDLPDHSLHAIGTEVCSLFVDDLSKDDLEGVVRGALSFAIPLVALEQNLHLLELFHGPTLAFKDVGARFLARILSRYLRDERRQVTILVATSGDTGSAVAHGFHQVDGIDVVVLYPSGKISKLQELQMTTLGGNIRACEVMGTFDDCQRMVREVLADLELNSRRQVTTANSMNLGRLIPQIVYYVWGISQWRRFYSATPDGAPAVIVPSGNFGNLTAALYAHQLGAEAGGFVAATNSNDTVPVYLKTGRYAPKASKATMSNAMDVGNPSNVARIRHLFGDSVDEIRRRLSAVKITDAGTIREIRTTYERTGVILDPHTAVGVAAGRKVAADRPVIVAATAHPGKFFDIIEKRTGIKVPIPEQLEVMLGRRKQSRKMPAEARALRELLDGEPYA